MADASKRHRGRVLDFTELVKDGVYAADDGWESLHILRQSVKGGVGIPFFSAGRLLGTSFQIIHDSGNGL